MYIGETVSPDRDQVISAMIFKQCDGWGTNNNIPSFTRCCAKNVELVQKISSDGTDGLDSDEEMFLLQKRVNLSNVT